MRAETAAKNRFWIRMSVVVVILVLLQVGIHLFILLGGPFDYAVAAYARGLNGPSPQYHLCFMCPKKIGYSNNTVRYQFAIDVTGLQTDRRVKVTVRKPLGNSQPEVAFELDESPSR